MSAARSLKTLLEGYGSAAPDCDVTGIELDSRRVSAGDLFLAVRGQGTHGLAHVAQALERGAAAVAWEPAPGVSAEELPVPEVAVADLSRRAGEIAARFYGRPADQMFTVGVTGTDGKTSTAHLVAQTLERLHTHCAYVGTLGHGFMGAIGKGTHTTPDAVSLQRLLAQSLEEGARAAALEVSSHALDQDRVAGVAFDVALLTNITRDHLDYHGTVERYAAAKRGLFERYRRGAAVLNRDDAHGARWATELERVTVYGLDGVKPDAGTWVLGRNLQLHANGLSLDIDSSWGHARLDSRLLGRFNAYNLLAALAAVLHKGIALPEAVAALAQATTVPGRIEAFRGPRARPLVVVDYAHTPDALAQILKAVRAHTQAKVWCVFGCGGDRDRGKRPLMGEAAGTLADQVIVTDDNPRSEAPTSIVAEIVAGLASKTQRYTVIHDRADAIRTAVAEAGADDIVVVAGKGHEDTQTYGREVRAFSDRAYVAQLVGVAA